MIYNVQFHEFFSRYEEDENARPPVMVLQPISSRLPNFLNKLIPAQQEEDQRKWWEIMCNLQENLRYISTYLFKVLINEMIAIMSNKCPCSRSTKCPTRPCKTTTFR